MQVKQYPNMTLADGLLVRTDSNRSVVLELDKLAVTRSTMIRNGWHALEINGEFYPSDDISFISEWGFLRGLEVLHRGRVDLHPIHHLTELGRLRVCTTYPSHLDFKFFRALCDCEIEWRHHVMNISQCETLRRLVIVYGPDEVFDQVLHLSSLRHFSLAYCAIEDVSGLEALRELNSLAVIGCRQVASLPEINHLPELKYLHVAECPRIQSSALKCSAHSVLRVVRLDACRRLGDLRFVHGLRALEQLWVLNCNEVASLAPIRELMQLRYLNIQGTRIADGDLSVILDLPRLEVAAFDDARSVKYSHKYSDIARVLRTRHPGAHDDDGAWRGFLGVGEVSDSGCE